MVHFEPKNVKVRQIQRLPAVLPVICCAWDVICRSREECVYMVVQANRMLALILEVVIFNDFAARV